MLPAKYHHISIKTSCRLQTFMYTKFWLINLLLHRSLFLCPAWIEFKLALYLRFRLISMSNNIHDFCLSFIRSFVRWFCLCVAVVRHQIYFPFCRKNRMHCIASIKCLLLSTVWSKHFGFIVIGIVSLWQIIPVRCKNLCSWKLTQWNSYLYRKRNKTYIHTHI